MNTGESELIITVGSVLSYIGTLFVCGTYYYVTVGIINMLYASKVGGYECEAIGFIAEHAALSASTWAFYFAYTMYGVFTHKVKNIREMRDKFVRDALLIWLFPLIFAIIPLFVSGGYGYSFLYCWISDIFPTDIYYALVVTVLYVPMGVQMVLMMIYYCKIYSAFKNTAGENNDTKALIVELMFYPVGVLLNYVISAMDRFINVGFGLNWLWFSYFHFFVKQSQGFINALVYGYSSKVRELIRNQKKGAEGIRVKLNSSFEMMNSSPAKRGSLPKV
jgi:hypothetical protein